MCEQILKKNTALQYNSNSLNCKNNFVAFILQWILISSSKSTLLSLAVQKQHQLKVNSNFFLIHASPIRIILDFRILDEPKSIFFHFKF